MGVSNAKLSNVAADGISEGHGIFNMNGNDGQLMELCAEKGPLSEKVLMLSGKFCKATFGVVVLSSLKREYSHQRTSYFKEVLHIIATECSVAFKLQDPG